MKLVLGLIVLAVIGLGAFYFISDPFSAKVDSALERHTTWTDENIAKDPEGYLHWSLNELSKIEDQLRGQQVTLRTQINSLERRLDADTVQLERMQRALEELKDTYRVADAGDRWPATYNETPLTRTALQDMILEADQRVVNLTTNLGLYPAAIRSSQANLQRVDTTLNDIRARRSEVERQMQQVRMASTFEGLDDLNDRINALLDTSRAIRSDAAESTVTLDDLLAGSGADDAQQRRFDDVMGGN